ncbi:MAG TPA: hypothetical protein VHV55_14480 [Pirellulales bacterium]|nr:hypothetical protein [Pirellulales bacterium]
MLTHTDRSLRSLLGAILLLAAVLPSSTLAAVRQLADFAEVEAVVTTHLNHRPGYQPGDLISQADWDAILASLSQAGWTPRDAAQTRKSLLPAKDFLVLEARSKEGRKFMRQVARYPGGYDRLDRLARMPYGVNTVRRLIQGPDGYKMLEYMTTTSGGAELGRQLSQDPEGKNFNRPTGRIYTAAELLDRLEASHNADFKRPVAKSR